LLGLALPVGADDPPGTKRDVPHRRAGGKLDELGRLIEVDLVVFVEDRKLLLAFVLRGRPGAGRTKTITAAWILVDMIVVGVTALLRARWTPAEGRRG